MLKHLTWTKNYAYNQALEVHRPFDNEGASGSRHMRDVLRRPVCGETLEYRLGNNGRDPESHIMVFSHTHAWYMVEISIAISYNISSSKL